MTGSKASSFVDKAISMTDPSYECPQHCSQLHLTTDYYILIVDAGQYGSARTVFFANLTGYSFRRGHHYWVLGDKTLILDEQLLCHSNRKLPNIMTRRIRHIQRKNITKPEWWYDRRNLKNWDNAALRIEFQDVSCRSVSLARSELGY